MRRLLPVALATLFLICVVVGAATYTLARDAPFRPGQPLFSIQLWSEQTWGLMFLSEDVERAWTLLNLLERRIVDLESVEGAEAERLAITYLDRAFGRALDSTGEVAAVSREPLMARLSELAQRAIAAIDALALARDESADAMLFALRAKLVDSLNFAGDLADEVTETSLANVPSALSRRVDETATSARDSLDGTRKVPFPSGAVDHSFFPLNKSHDLECKTCHDGGTYRGTSPSCTACHAGDDAHKGAYGVACARCHTIDSWRNASFDHSIIGARDCADCHSPPENHYSGACRLCHNDARTFSIVIFDHATIGERDCVTCHAAPANHYQGTCRACHGDTSDFRNARFDHSFIGGIDCSTCHTPPANHYQGTCRACHGDTSNFRNASFDHSFIGGTDCSTCHTPPANHYQGTCRACHGDTSNFRNASFDHSFIGGTDCGACHAPPANHYQGSCRACHGDTSSFRNASFDHSFIGGTDCSTCHAPPANHYQGSCRACHGDTSNFRNARFDHSVIGGTECGVCHAPPANHYQGSCRACHGDTSNFRNVNFSHTGLTDCQGCHARPNNHFPGQCSDCHSTDTFSGASFSHAFPINHKNANGDCATCHPGGDTASYSCANCHQPNKMDEKHKEIRGYSTDCVSCHANGKKPGED